MTEKCNYLASGTMSISGLEAVGENVYRPTKRINAEMLWNIRVNVGDFDIKSDGSDSPVKNVCVVNDGYYEVYWLNNGCPDVQRVERDVFLHFREANG